MKSKELKRLQEKRLRALIRHTYQNVIFYRKIWKSLGIRADDIKTIEDLNKLPIIRKEDIIKNYNFCIAENYRHLYRLGKVVLRRTAGTSGIPMKMIFDERGWDYLEGIYLRSFLSLGYDIRKPLAYYWYRPLEKKFYHYLGFLKKNLISSQLNEIKQLKILQNLQPEYLYYFPSTLYSIAKLMLYEGIKIRPKFIVTQGEILSKKMRDIIERAFNAPVFDFYATTETGITAWQCKERNGYHINADNVIMEFIADNENVSSGEKGSVVLTSLMNYIFPLIRYEIGDIGVPLNEKCSCGRSLPLMKSIEGRLDDINRLKKKKLPSPKEIIDSIASIPKIYKFQFILRQNNIRVEIVPIKSLSKKDIEQIRSKIRNFFKKHIEIEIVREIPKEKTGKRSMIKIY
jgi:phenylacetate-CoA ligase